MLTARKPTQETIDVVAGLGGRWNGSYAMCLCPAHADRNPSLSVRQGDHGILVHCFAGCQREDILRAIAQSEPVPRSPRPDYRVPQTRASALRLWEQGGPITGTLAQEYLRSRCLPEALDDVRFHPRCPFGRRPNTVMRPALLVAVRIGVSVEAIQRIVLTRDGCAHGGKMMLGRPGVGAWSPRFSGPVLALAESMEDAAAYTKLHAIPCWGVLGAERLARVRLPDHISRLVIAEDNNAPGRRSAAAACQAHARPGLALARHSSAPFGDWAEANEILSRRLLGAA